MPKLFQNLAKSGFAAAQTIELPELGVERSVAQNAIDALRGKPITNAATGISARLSSSAKGKLVSNKATGKSKSNGFSRQQHNAIVASIAEIFKAATLLVSRRDRAGDANILSIKRFAAKVRFNRQQAVAWITVKESKLHGHHIYSVEAIKLEALDRIVEVVSGNTPHASSASTRGILAFFSSCVNAVFGRKSTALLLALAGSWKFWLCSALAAAAGVSVILIREIHAGPGDDPGHPYYRLVSTNGMTSTTSNPNAADRVLLMNADRNEKGFVDCENLTGATTSKGTRNWWEYVNQEAVKLTGFNLVKGTEFKLHEKGDDGRTLWHMKSCRAGNLNPTTKTGTVKNYQNLLPYNTTSAYSYKSRTTPCSGQHLAGTLVMQNTPEAEVISSCLPDGIGTIYFDAVNGFTGYQKGRLQLEVAYGVYETNKYGKVTDDARAAFRLEKDASGNFVPPDDAHCDAYEVEHIGEEPKVIPYDRVAWVPVNLTGAWHCNSSSGKIPEGTVLNLKMPESGTAAQSFENFYRVWAPIADPAFNPAVADYARQPMRFRIRRMDDPAKEGTRGMSLDGDNIGKPENNGLLILDNIIASYPPMKAWAVPPDLRYVTGGGPRNVIGWSGIVATNYPAIGMKDLEVRAGLAFATNAPPDVAGDWMSDGTRLGANFTWRWRYREQLTNDWEDLPLGVEGGTNLVSAAGLGLNLTNLIGDVEFKYTTVLDAPYYGYLDYSGSTTISGTPGYTERIKAVESGLDPEARGKGGIPGTLPSCGTNFFFRLRPGASEQLEWRLELRRQGETAACRTNAFWLVSDGTWKTFLKTTTNAVARPPAVAVGKYEFRIIGVNPANVFGGSDVTELPWSGKPLHSATNGVSAVTDRGWTKIDIDAVTGALMFQVMESEDSAVFMTYSIVRADFQDFNLWSDADLGGGLYTGAYLEGRGRQSGSSPDARQFPGELPSWSMTSGTNTIYWGEDFSGVDPKTGYGPKPYEMFKQARTPNGWSASYGQWANARWRTDSYGMALLMSGNGAGEIAYQRTDVSAPHGIDYLSFDARVAQAAKFKEFAVYSGSTEIEDMTDYLFMTRAVMHTTRPETAFDGNGSVSLVAYYQPDAGCYELRVERSGDNEVSLYLYKWIYDEDEDEPLPHLLGRHTTRPAKNTTTYLRCSNDGTNTLQNTASYGELFIRCMTSDGTTTVEAGVMNASKKLGDSTSGTSHYVLKFKDEGTIAGLGKPFTSGTFGFGALNCPAQIINPVYYPEGEKATVPNVTGPSADGPSTSNPTCGSGNVTYAGTDEYVFNPSADPTKYKNWSIKGNKFEVTKVAGNYAVEAKPQEGAVTLYTWPKTGSRDDAEPVTDGTRTVGGFTNATFRIDVRSDVDSLLRLVTAPKSSDIVVGDIRFDQWCAASYSDNDNADFYRRPDWTLACPTNYVYMNGWVNVAGDAHTIDLQPLRGRRGQPIAIRAPLMDGESERGYALPRGIGLGSFTFTYRNADSNCVLKVQYREMTGAGDLRDATASVDGWTDVPRGTVNFSTNRYDLASGKVTVTVGLHDTKGVMRLIVDPAVVADARDAEKNPDGDARYGAITITGFSSTDEPPVDGTCWRAWNLRTTDDEQELSIYDSEETSTFAFALNNSVEDDVEPEPGESEEDTKARYAQHVPYLQSPTFATNIVGEISFTARKLHPDDPPTEVAVLGAKDGGEPDDAQWECLEVILVTNAVFSETYAYKTPAGKDYSSFRLAVIGVKDVKVNYGEKMQVPTPQRVLIDDVAISEAVRGKIAFDNVGAFRTPLDTHTYVTNLFEIAQQPMCEESWSVQCEIYASQLKEEVDLDSAEVTFRWYRGDKWGYAKWADDPEAKSAKLVRIGNGDLPSDQKGKFIYRGSYASASEAIVDPIYDSGAVVQYMLEVKYRTKDSVEPVTQLLTSGEWTKPAWYRGVDYNAQNGGFAAYTILDTVAYGYAWINEVNVYDGPDPDSDISGTNQFVEIAMPEQANISGWRLEFVTGGLDENPDAVLYTNVVATFTDDPALWSPGLVPSTKDAEYMDEDSTYVFLAVGNKATASKEMMADHRIDGAWAVSEDETIGEQVNRSTGYIDCGMPIGIRLVRPSGIVEHEIVVAGTNRYDFYGPPFSWTYSQTNYLARMNRYDPDRSWTAPCADAAFPQGYGCSVTNGTSVAADASVWAHWTKTPGRVNECNGVKEYIDPLFPTPQGSKIRLYAQLQGGYINQSIGEFVSTVSNVVLWVQKDSPAGTNIVYQITNGWYELESLVETSSDGTREHPEKVGSRGRFDAAVAVNALHDVKVVAKTRVRADVDALLGPDNDYREAVLKWLEAGKWGPRSNRRDFKNQGGEIHQAMFAGLSGTTNRLLRLTEMYWLDLDPTVEGTVFQAGMCDPPQPVDVERAFVDRPHIGPGEGTVVTNDVCEDIILGVFMKIWNENGEFEPYAPYTLNGIRPGQTSMDHPADWDSVTFKITGYLQNGMDATKDPDKIWMPLRYFVFDEGSFDPVTFKARIQVMDPFVQFAEWKKYFRCPVYFRWDLDTRKFDAVADEVLCPDSTFK